MSGLEDRDLITACRLLLAGDPLATLAIERAMSPSVLISEALAQGRVSATRAAFLAIVQSRATRMAKLARLNAPVCILRAEVALLVRAFADFDLLRSDKPALPEEPKT